MELLPITAGKITMPSEGKRLPSPNLKTRFDGKYWIASVSSFGMLSKRTCSQILPHTVLDAPQSITAQLKDSARRRDICVGES